MFFFLTFFEYVWHFEPLRQRLGGDLGLQVLQWPIQPIAVAILVEKHLLLVDYLRIHSIRVFLKFIYFHLVLNVILIDVGELLDSFADFEHDLFADLVADGHKILMRWRELKIIDHLGCELLWLVVGVADVPLYLVGVLFELKLYSHQMLTVAEATAAKDSVFDH